MRTVTTDGMVGVGRLSLHIHCAGEGAPTVVLDAGLGNDGSVWSGVQLEIARFSRACVYDRAGMGYSDGPPPVLHTNRQMAQELHTLLERAGLAAPYVLVGNSMGGVNVRLLASEHPDEVAGMVLVDAVVDPMRVWRHVPEAEIAKFRDALRKLPEGLDFETVIAGAADMRASSRSLGAKPLVVLTRSIEDEQPWASADVLAKMLQDWHKMHAELAGLSTNAVQVVAPNTHHYVQLEAPQLGVAAVSEVVKAVRTHGRLNESTLSALARESH